MKYNKMSTNKLFWVIFIPYLLVVVLITSIIAGCETRNNGDLNKNYDGTKVTVTVVDESIYKLKVTVKFQGNSVATKYYCERLIKPAVNEWIRLVNCKNFNGDLYILYNNMKWFTFEDYNGDTN